jgi:hypothetical protein
MEDRLYCGYRRCKIDRGEAFRLLENGEVNEGVFERLKKGIGKLLGK